MNWSEVVTSVVTVVAMVGPAFLYHHKKIKAVVDAVSRVVNAAEGGPVK